MPSLGYLAELLLFYRKVTVFLDEKSTQKLFSQVSPEILIPFFEEYKDSLDIRWLTWGVWTKGFRDSDLQIFRLGDEESIGVDEPYLTYIKRVDGIRNKQLTTRFLEIVKKESVQYDIFNAIFDTDTMNNDFLNYLRQYIDVFPTSFSKLPKDLRFDVKGNYGRFEVRVNSKQSLSKRRLFFIQHHLTRYVETMSELPIWTQHSSEILANEHISFQIRTKLNGLINQQLNSQEMIDTFQSVFVNDAKDIKYIIDNGHRSFLEFIKFYEKTHTFREWIAGQSNDANLLKEYYQSVTANTWFDRLPTKVARWILFTGLGLGADALGAGGLGIATGVTIGAFDTFLLDHLIRGWKPNQFINNELKPFLDA